MGDRDALRLQLFENTRLVFEGLEAVGDLSALTAKVEGLGLSIAVEVE